MRKLLLFLCSAACLFAALDNAVNFGKVTLSTGYDAAATSVILAGGDGAKLPTVPFNVTWWNATDYSDPTDDPNREIVRVTNISTDTLTITRAQETTSAKTHNLAKTYIMIAGITAKVLNVDLAPMQYKTCVIMLGADNGASDLVALDIGPQKQQCPVYDSAHVIDITVAANGGTPQVTVGRNRAGSVVNIAPSITTGASGALICANVTGSGTGHDGVTTCNVLLDSSNRALLNGDWIDMVTGTASTGAKRITVAVTWKLD